MPQEYRRMAEECFGWASEAQTDEVRLVLRQSRTNLVSRGILR